MKHYLTCMLLVLLSGCGDSGKMSALQAENTQLKKQLQEFTEPKPQTLYEKFASISAGKPIPSSDTSVARSEYLIKSAAKKFNISEEKVANIAVLIAQKLRSEQIDANPLHFLEGVLIADTDDLPTTAARYATIRHSTGMNNEDAFVGLIGIHEAVRSINRKVK